MAPRPEDRRVKELITSIRGIDDKLSQLLRLLEPHKESEYSICPDQPTEYKQKEPRPQATIVTITERPNAQIAQEAKDREGQKGFQGHYLVVQWCLFATTLAAFGAAFYYACTAKHQLIEMRRANNLTVEALEINRQPWVGFDGPITITDQDLFGAPERPQLRLALKVYIKNYGGSPALRVSTFFRVIYTPINTSWKQYLTGNECAEAERQATKWGGPIVFPSIGEPREIVAVGATGGFRIVNGCITYQGTSSPWRYRLRLQYGVSGASPERRSKTLPSITFRTVDRLDLINARFERVDPVEAGE